MAGVASNSEQPHQEEEAETMVADQQPQQEEEAEMMIADQQPLEQEEEAEIMIPDQQPQQEKELEMIIADQQQEEAEIMASEEESIMEPKNSSLSQFNIMSTCGMRFEKYQSVWIDVNLVPAVKVIQKEFQPRPDDIFFASLPKTGTTWGKALLYTIIEFACVGNKHPADTNDNSAADEKMFAVDEKNPHALVPTMETYLFNSSDDEEYDISCFSDFPSPRLLHTHLPIHTLPLLVKSSPNCKIVYIARNPRDSFVSLWKFYNRLRGEGSRYLDGDLSKETVFDAFCSGFYYGGPFAENVLSYWHESRRNPNQVMFVTYEDLQADCVGWVKRMGVFLGCSTSLLEENAQKIADKCSFDTLCNLQVNRKGKVGTRKYGMKNAFFFREGKVGEWKKHFTPQMEERIYLEIEQKLSDQGLHFTNSL